MNENLETDTGLDANDVLEYENELGVLEEGEELPEAGESREETGETGDSELGALPGEEQVEGNISEELLTELVVEVKAIKEYLPELVENEEKAAMSIWEKPLSDYTVAEGISLITMFMILGVIIFVMVGGIIKCKI